MTINRNVDLKKKLQNSRTAIFKEQLFLLNEKSSVFEIKNIMFLAE